MDDIFASLLSMRVDPNAPQLPGMIKSPLTEPLPSDLTPNLELSRSIGGIPTCSSCYDKRFDADKVRIPETVTIMKMDAPPLQQLRTQRPVTSVFHQAFLPGDPTGWTSQRLFDSNLSEWVAIEFPHEVTVKAIAFKVRYVDSLL